jgi:hypothetical protein
MPIRTPNPHVTTYLQQGVVPHLQACAPAASR